MNIDGIQYAPVIKEGLERRIVMVDSLGLTLVGDVDLSGESDRVTIYNARCVIRWGTRGHLAELAKGPTPNTKLGESCDVNVYRKYIIADYLCGSGWND